LARELVGDPPIRSRAETMRPSNDTNAPTKVNTWRAETMVNRTVIERSLLRRVATDGTLDSLGGPSDAVGRWKNFRYNLIRPDEQWYMHGVVGNQLAYAPDFGGTALDSRYDGRQGAQQQRHGTDDDDTNPKTYPPVTGDEPRARGFSFNAHGNALLQTPATTLPYPYLPRRWRRS
jgi:hypothetical protein